MAIKIYGDKIVFPDNSEQTTASDSADTSYTKEEIDAQQNAQDVKIDKNTSDLTNVYTKTEVDDSQSAQDTEIAKKINDAPGDGETYARNNETWVSISDSSGIPDAPVDGLMYGRKDGEWGNVADAGNIYTKTEIDAQQNAQDVNIQANTDAIAEKANTDDTYTKTQTDTLLDNKANVGDSYTKAETYNNTEIDAKLFDKADKATTYTKEEVDDSQDAQDVTISGNTSAIGALSGRVSANESDIATLQDGVFFSSSYSADYPSSPNRDPETGNMYMQDLSAFTYSYADTNQVFISKTDEQGNVRQFTAVKPDDTIVLNQVESPNYGRYKVTSVNDLGAYVNLIVEFQIGEGTLLEGDTVALQAFPASAGGDSIWTEVGDDAVYDGDIKVNGVTVGKGSGDIELNTAVGSNALRKNTTGTRNTVVGRSSMYQSETTNGNTAVGYDVMGKNIAGNNNTAVGNNSLTSETGSNNVAVGNNSLQNNTGGNNSAIGRNALVSNTGGNENVSVGSGSLFNSTGNNNTAIGYLSGNTLTSGSNNIFLGNNAQPSSATVSNEVTIGNDSVSKTRLKGEVKVESGKLDLRDLTTGADFSTIKTDAENGINFDVYGGTRMSIKSGGVSTTQDIKVNGLTVGTGNTTNKTNTALGQDVLSNTTSTGNYNSAVGDKALSSVTTGFRNSAIGWSAGSTLIDGNNNLILGNDAQPSAPDVSNEVTIGNASVTTLRMGNGDVIYPTGGGGGGAGGAPEVTVLKSGSGTYTVPDGATWLEFKMVGGGAGGQGGGTTTFAGASASGGGTAGSQGGVGALGANAEGIIVRGQASGTKSGSSAQFAGSSSMFGGGSFNKAGVANNGAGGGYNGAAGCGGGGVDAIISGPLDATYPYAVGAGGAAGGGLAGGSGVIYIKAHF